MKWYYGDAGNQVGPIDDVELDRLVGAGTVRGETLVWHEGMAAWQVLAVVRGVEQRDEFVERIRQVGRPGNQVTLPKQLAVVVGELIDGQHFVIGQQ